MSGLAKIGAAFSLELRTGYSVQGSAPKVQIVEFLFDFSI